MRGKNSLLYATFRILCLSCTSLFSFASVTYAGKIPKPPKRDYVVAYEDTASGRLYVSMDSGIMANHDSLIARLQQIRKERTWDIWGDKIVRVELFSDERFARPREKVPKGRKSIDGKFVHLHVHSVWSLLNGTPYYHRGGKKSLELIRFRDGSGHLVDTHAERAAKSA